MSRFVPDPDPDGCVSVTTHEAALTAIANEMEANARALLGDKPGRVEMATAKELFLGAIRARKAAGELAQARLDRDHTSWIMREYQRMKGTDANSRPRLRRKPTQ
jgi:hypothetical protein